MVMTESPIQLVARMRMRVFWLSVTNVGDCVIKVLGAGDDPNFDPQVVDGNIAAVNLGKAYRVFFRGEDGRRPAFEAAVDHIDDFLLAVAVVVSVPLGVDEVGAKAQESVLETLGNRDAGNGGDGKAPQFFQWMAFPGEYVLQVQRLVSALDNLGLVVELADGLSKFLGSEFARFGDENVMGALEVADWLTKRAPRKEIMIAKRVVAVDEANIEAALQGEVLKPVIEEKRIAAEFRNGVAPALDTVFVHQDDDIAEVGGQHVGFVAGLLAIEQQRPSVRHDFGWDLVFLECEFREQPLPERSRDTFVAPRENSHTTATLLEGAGEDFHHGCLAGSANTEVADADDLAAEGVVAEDAVLPEAQPDLDAQLVNLGEAEQNRAGDT